MLTKGHLLISFWLPKQCHPHIDPASPIWAVFKNLLDAPTKYIFSIFWPDHSQYSLGPSFNECCILQCSSFSLKPLLHWSASTSNWCLEPPGSSSSKIGKPPFAYDHQQVSPFLIALLRPSPASLCCMHLESNCLIFNLKLCLPLSSFISLLPGL